MKAITLENDSNTKKEKRKTSNCAAHRPWSDQQQAGGSGSAAGHVHATESCRRPCASSAGSMWARRRTEEKTTDMCVSVRTYRGNKDRAKKKQRESKKIKNK